MTTEVTPPGVIRSGGIRSADLVIEGFGIHDFCLTLRLLVDGISEGFVFVEDGDLSLGIFTDHDLSLAQGVIRTVGLNLVDDLVGLHGQVFGQNAGLLMGKDDVQVISFE